MENFMNAAYFCIFIDPPPLEKQNQNFTASGIKGITTQGINWMFKLLNTGMGGGISLQSYTHLSGNAQH